MTEILYDVDGLVIDVYYDKISHALKWSIQSTGDSTPTFNADQIKTIIFQLEQSLDIDVDVGGFSDALTAPGGKSAKLCDKE